MTGCRFDWAGKLVAEAAPPQKPTQLAAHGGSGRSQGRRRGDIVTIALVPAGGALLPPRTGTGDHTIARGILLQVRLVHVAPAKPQPDDPSAKCSLGYRQNLASGLGSKHLIASVRIAVQLRPIKCYFWGYLRVVIWKKQISHLF